MLCEGNARATVQVTGKPGHGLGLPAGVTGQGHRLVASVGYRLAAELK